MRLRGRPGGNPAIYSASALTAINLFSASQGILSELPGQLAAAALSLGVAVGEASAYVKQ